MSRLRQFVTVIHRRTVWQVLLVYIGVSWGVLEATGLFIEQFGLPAWAFPAAVLLLAIGLIILLATAWMQVQPAAQAPEAPTPWEVDLVSLKESVTSGRLPHLTWARAILGGVFAFSLLFGLAGLYVLLSEQPRALPVGDAGGGEAAPGIAVLPFHVVGSPELELWREGMVDLLSTNLDGAAGLRTIDPRGLLSRWHSEIGEGVDAPDRESALAVARGAGASYAVMGDAVDLGGGVRVSAEVYDLGSGDLLGRVQVEGAADSVLALVDRLSIQLLSSGLVREGAALPRLNVAAVTTNSLEALKAYLEGEQRMRRGDWIEAANQFGRAVEVDSTFALADFQLTLALGWTEAFSERVYEHSRRAARHSEQLPERIVLRIKGNAETDALLPDAVRTLEDLTGRYPDDVEGWYRLGEAYAHLGNRALIPARKAVTALARTVELDPGYAAAYIHLIDFALFDQDSVEAGRFVEAYREVGRDDPRSIAYSVVYDYLWGDSAAKERAKAALDTLDGAAIDDVLSQSLQVAPDLHEPALELAEYLLAADRPAPHRAEGYSALGSIYLHRGRLEESSSAYAEEAVLEGRRADVSVATFDIVGYSLDTGDVEAARSAAEILRRDPSPVQRFLLGALAADEGAFVTVENQIAALDSVANQRDAEGAAIAAEASRSLAQALRCYAEVRAGDLQAALAEFEKPMPRLDGGAHGLLRYELGKLSLERGELVEAERFFSSFLATPAQTQAQYYLGAVYERMGDEERARVHYARFVRWWEDCDPELRPWRERGRQALERLTAEL
jgi:tetratricopeptide (TPR) repeat protein/TolB-like protein